MTRGKSISQACHASVEATLKSSQEKVNSWRKEGMKKVVVKVVSESELIAFQRKAKQEKLITALIKDAGKTFFKKPTITCLAIGPDEEYKIDKVTNSD